MSSGIRAFFSDLRKKRIVEILAAFIGGGWLILEFVHWLLVDHYHFPEKIIDITFVTILGTLIGTLIWRWFSGREKPRKLKLERVLIPLVLLVTILMDINLLFHLKEPGLEAVPAPNWKNSIAVLPFVDMSPQKDQEYFCDGMTEDLINRLSNIKDLKVPARTSAFMFKGKTPDMRDVGEKLKVHTVLEGSVQKSGNRLRHHRPAHQHRRRVPPLVGTIRPRPEGCLRHPGRDLLGDRRSPSTEAHPSGEREDVRPLDR